MRWVSLASLLSCLARQGFADDFSQWMAEDAVQRLPLGKLTLPGTHDSGTYAITAKMLPVSKTDEFFSELIAAVSKIPLFPVDDAIKLWAKTQSVDIYKQLQYGARYLDIRLALKGKGTGDWTVTHGPLIADLSLQDVMKQVRRFLDDSPKEVVVVEVSHFGDGFKPTADHVAWLADTIEQIIGLDLLISRPANDDEAVHLLNYVSIQDLKGRCFVSMSNWDMGWDSKHTHVWRSDGGTPGSSDSILYNTYPDLWYEKDVSAYNSAVVPAFNSKDKIPANGKNFPKAGDMRPVLRSELFKVSWTATASTDYWSDILGNTMKVIYGHACGITCRAQEYINPAYSGFREHSRCPYVGNAMLVDEMGGSSAAMIVKDVIESRGGSSACGKSGVGHAPREFEREAEPWWQTPCRELGCPVGDLCGRKDSNSTKPDELFCCKEPMGTFGRDFSYPTLCKVGSSMQKGSEAPASERSLFA